MKFWTRVLLTHAPLYLVLCMSVPAHVVRCVHAAITVRSHFLVNLKSMKILKRQT